MKALFSAVSVVAMLVAGSAFAGDAKGAIKSVTGRVITLDNGQAYTFPAAPAGQPDIMAGLAVGQTVTLTFTAAGTINNVSKVAK